MLQRALRAQQPHARASGPRAHAGLPRGVHGYPVFSGLPSCRSGTRACAASLTCARAVSIDFNVAYRVQFGQSLGIVGSSSALGAWDAAAYVPMTWSDGDVWQANVVTPVDALEYKYIVVDSSGNVVRWQPGGNFGVSDAEARRVCVTDAWDGSIHDIQAAAAAAGGAPGAEPEGSSERAAAAGEACASVDLGQGSEDSGRLSPDLMQLSMDKHDLVLQQAMNDTYGALQDALDVGLMLANDVDPADPALLVNDQKLAAVHRKAVSLSRALTAGAQPPPYILREIDGGDENDN